MTFTLAGPAGKAAEAGEESPCSSSGTVANITHLGNGRYSALYTAPPTLPPQRAHHVIDKRNPDYSFGGVAIPLKGKANFPVVGKPNSNILLKIGDREFGPIPADAAGKARSPSWCRRASLNHGHLRPERPAHRDPSTWIPATSG